MVLLASSYDQTRFFKAADLKSEKKLRIKTVTEELVGAGSEQEKKLVVWFTNDERGLVLNKTNNRTLRGAFGDDCAGWAAKIVVLFPARPISAGSWCRPCGCGFLRRGKRRPVMVQRSRNRSRRQRSRPPSRALPTI